MPLLACSIATRALEISLLCGRTWRDKATPPTNHAPSTLFGPAAKPSLIRDGAGLSAVGARGTRRGRRAPTCGRRGGAATARRPRARPTPLRAAARPPRCPPTCASPPTSRASTHGAYMRRRPTARAARPTRRARRSAASRTASQRRMIAKKDDCIEADDRGGAMARPKRSRVRQTGRARRRDADPAFEPRGATDGRLACLMSCHGDPRDGGERAKRRRTEPATVVVV